MYNVRLATSQAQPLSDNDADAINVSPVNNIVYVLKQKVTNRHSVEFHVHIQANHRALPHRAAIQVHPSDRYLAEIKLKINSRKTD